MLLVGIASAEILSGLWQEGKNGWFFPIDELRFYTSERPDTIEDATQTITVLNDVFTRKNMDLYAAIVPIRARLYEDQLPDTIKLPAVIKQRYDHALADFKAGHVRSPDLNTLFLNSPERLATYPLYLKGDQHWSGPGGLLAAEVLSTQITSSGKVTADDGVASEIVRGEATLSPKPLPTVDGRPVAKQTEMYRPISVKAQGQSLLGDETFPIAVVGDSFSNGERDGVGLFAFSSLIEHFTQRRVYNAAQAGLGPWTPMLDYLKSSAFQNSPPKVLVWEMWEAFLTGDGQGYPLPNFLRRVGPMVMGTCSQGRTVTFPSVSLNLSNYLVLKGFDQHSAPTIRYVSSSGATDSEQLDVTEDGRAYVFPGQKGAVTVTVEGTDQVRSAELCEMPSSFVDAISMNGKTVDFALNLATNQLDFRGFYTSNDGLTNRWALGKSSDLSFISKKPTQGTISIRATSPFPNQTIQVLFNGAQIGNLKADRNGLFILNGPIKMVVGENKLRFAYSEWRTKGSQTSSTLDKNDSRDLSVNFQALKLSVE